MDVAALRDLFLFAGMIVTRPTAAWSARRRSSWVALAHHASFASIVR